MGTEVSPREICAGDLCVSVGYEFGLDAPVFRTEESKGRVVRFGIVGGDGGGDDVVVLGG